MTPLPAALVALTLAVALPAGWFDLRARRIPNWLVLAGLSAALAGRFAMLGVDGLWAGVNGFGLALAIYFPLFALRAMGAGDAKLMAALGAALGAANWLVLFFVTAFAGAAVAIVVVLAKGRLGQTLRNVGFILGELARLRAPHVSREELSAGHEKSISLPHGAAIAGSAVLTVAAMWLVGAVR